MYKAEAYGRLYKILDLVHYENLKSKEEQTRLLKKLKEVVLLLQKEKA
jgi:hypothetical protein